MIEQVKGHCKWKETWHTQEKNMLLLAQTQLGKCIGKLDWE